MAPRSATQLKNLSVLGPLQEQEKSAKVSRRLNALKEARSSAEALEEMLRSWQESKGVETSPSTLELLQVNPALSLTPPTLGEHL